MNPTPSHESSSPEMQEMTPELRKLFRAVVERAPSEAAPLLEGYPETFVVEMLELLNPAMAVDMRKCGADPVTASSIVLTTITDVASLAVFLGLATWIV
jgi:hypothetical protein